MAGTARTKTAEASNARMKGRFTLVKILATCSHFPCGRGGRLLPSKSGRSYEEAADRRSHVRRRVPGRRLRRRARAGARAPAAGLRSHGRDAQLRAGRAALARL